MKRRSSGTFDLDHFSESGVQMHDRRGVSGLSSFPIKTVCESIYVKICFCSYSTTASFLICYQIAPLKLGVSERRRYFIYLASLEFIFSIQD